MTIYSTPSLVCSLIFAALGLFVLFHRPKTQEKTVFSILCFEAFYWQFLLFISFFNSDPSYLDYLAKIAYLAITLIPFTFYHFIVSYLKIKKERWLVLLFYALGIVLVGLLRTDLFVSGHQKFSWGNFPTPGPVYPIFVISAFVTMTRGLWLLVKALKNPILYGFSKNQLYYIFVGLLLYYSCSVDFAQVYGAPWYPISVFLFLASVSVISYAILRYRLMDINIVLRKSLVYSLLVTSITIVYFMLVWASERAFQMALGYQSFPLTISALLAVALLFQPIKNRIQAFVDRHFFKGTVDVLAEENERLQEELIKTEKLRIAGTLASGIAHEIKNPLTSLKAFTSFLEEKHNDPLFRKKFKEIIGQEINKIDQLVHNLLNFAKPHPPTFESTDIHKALDQTFGLINTSLASANVSLVRVYHRPNTEILGDASQLQQAFLNLFLNAMDAMPKGGELRISTHTENGWLTIRIEDTGVGMAKEQLEHIFEPFYSTKESGTGLGLAITKRIIEDHQGKIKVTSTPNKGSAFEISLPLT